MASPLFSLAWKHVHVISSDRMPDGKLRVVVMSNHANKIAEYASRMFSIFQDKSLMIEIKFVKQKDVCNFGHVGISDYKKRFWPLGAVFIMDGPENTDNAVSLLKPGKKQSFVI